MNKYFVSEIYPDALYTAGSQREDIEEILQGIGYSPIHINTPERSLFSWFTLYKNVIINAKKLTPPGIVFFHFPIRSRAFRIFFELVRKKGFSTIVYEIDLEGLREGDKQLLDYEMKWLKKSNVIITQNKIKKNQISQSIQNKQIITYEMHDYLQQKNEIFQKERKKTTEIIFAGNLDKASFIHLLGQLNGLKFFIYGQTDNPPSAHNIIYRGKVDPRILPITMEGSFGLVWDGSSLETGKEAGTYLRYNIPHKMALYITAGLPLIVWDESAMAEWVLEKRIGITVSSLQEISGQLSKLSETDYQSFLKNMIPIRQNMAEGYYLKRAIIKAEELLAENK